MSTVDELADYVKTATDKADKMAAERPELLRCPFCGGDAVYKQGGEFHEASCTDYCCPGYRMAIGCEDRRSAAMKWNTRAI